ncbi:MULTISPECIES: calcium/sodium antiporter [Hyphomonas]|jgi:cation:H+ antiporter|uniref:Sodium/calcium exchanger n=1 Tax=Hyphomonas jannaschiana VP2 TaxID=1280952 RepID=A0A059FKV4_9PROT|nr:calcium/sodium antiporter [Hyphomonas jannaschiana]KCZ91161.1 sodium/calcium exchanger [Hyphomonas jannaschiana VP2]
MPELSLIAALVGGLVIMALAGNALVSGAVSLAARMGVSPLVAGIFIVGFGTSAPEMIVSLDAALSDRSGLALGNIVGSNIANVFLVLGLPALIAPIAAGGVGEKRGLTAVIVAAVAWIGITAIMPLTPMVGICFIALLIAYSGLTFIAARRAVAAGKDPGVTEEEDPHLPLWLALVYVPLGILGLVLGADLVIEGGVGIAMFLNVPEEYIGLTLLAVGTSLPEIGAGLVAVVKKQGEVLIGNVLGSNVFNILGAGGIISLFGPVQMAPTFQQYDHWALGLATLVLAYVILTKARIGRLFGLLLLLIYAAYIYGLITGLNITGLFQPAGT